MLIAIGDTWELLIQLLRQTHFCPVKYYPFFNHCNFLDHILLNLFFVVTVENDDYMLVQAAVTHHTVTLTIMCEAFLL